MYTWENERVKFAPLPSLAPRKRRRSNTPLGVAARANMMRQQRRIALGGEPLPQEVSRQAMAMHLQNMQKELESRGLGHVRLQPHPDLLGPMEWRRRMKEEEEEGRKVMFVSASAPSTPNLPDEDGEGEEGETGQDQGKGKGEGERGGRGSGGGGGYFARVRTESDLTQPAPTPLAAQPLRQRSDSDPRLQQRPTRKHHHKSHRKHGENGPGGGRGGERKWFDTQEGDEIDDDPFLALGRFVKNKWHKMGAKKSKTSLREELVVEDVAEDTTTTPTTITKTTTIEAKAETETEAEAEAHTVRKSEDEQGHESEKEQGDGSIDLPDSRSGTPTNSVDEKSISASTPSLSTSPSTPASSGASSPTTPTLEAI